MQEKTKFDELKRLQKNARTAKAFLEMSLKRSQKESSCDLIPFTKEKALTSHNANSVIFSFRQLAEVLDSLCSKVE